MLTGVLLGLVIATHIFHKAYPPINAIPTSSAQSSVPVKLTTIPSPRPSTSPAPAPSIEPTESFLNETYHYSFRYPSGFSLVRDKGDRIISLHNPSGTTFGPGPTLTFWVVAPDVEQKALEVAFATIRKLSNIQQSHLDTFERGETVLGSGFPAASIQPFISKHPSNDPNKAGAVGFSIESNIAALTLDGESGIGIEGTYVRLRSGQVLFVSYESHGLPDPRQQIINSVLDTLDTFP